jgi:hypothetical protein
MNFEVLYLEIPASWQVGQSTLRPAGWLRDRLEPRPEHWPDVFFEPLEEATWPTIEVPILNLGDTDMIGLARNVARDSLAVLDLYRRARMPLVPIDNVGFGLAVDVYSGREYRWITDAAGALGQTSAGRYGSVGTWTFAQEDIDAFREDPRFAYLDDALRSDDPTDWQARTVTAIRTFALSRLVGRSALRIALLATALEALLGDKYTEGGTGTGAHQLARRASFVVCGAGTPAGIHGPARPACPYLVAEKGETLTKMLRERQARGEPTFCSAYWEIRDLSRDRGNALHGARLDFGPIARTHDRVVRSVILGVLDWITQRGATRWAEYEAAIKAIPPA